MYSSPSSAEPVPEMTPIAGPNPFPVLDSAMPRCPNCEFRSETIADFVYANLPYTEREGHDVNPYEAREAERYLVCPDCGVVIG
jgi:DNA-directed RNA polymerase subunit RPC12/RpoP